MDDNSVLRDGWSWMDEDLRLDVGSPLAMPDYTWDDLVDNEGVVRSLFPSFHLTDHLKDSDALGLSEERQDSMDCNPAPLKRRRVLELHEDDLMDNNPFLPEPSETSNDFLVGVCEDLQQVGPLSSGSAWYMTNESSLSCVDDTIEQSSGSWRVGCISDSDTSDVQELIHCPINNLINARTTKAIAENNSGYMPPTKRAMRSTISDGIQRTHQPTLNGVNYAAGNVQFRKSQQDIVEIPLCLKESVLEQPSKDCLNSRESAISVLAYPFALVKPIGIQGDVTLQDINQRINSSPGRVTTCSEQPKSTSSSPYSGKSVLALTKIYTEGNGTITIMRTKGRDGHQNVHTVI